MMNGDGINRYSPLGGGGDGQEKGKKKASMEGCNCILYFLKSTLILTKSIGLTNSCQRHGIVPACAGVCRAYLIVH